jgi:phage portal protein BeeE
VPVNPRTMIQFTSPNPALLIHGARAIRACLTLDRVAAQHALGAPPIGIFTPAEGVDPGDEDVIQEYLDNFEAKRVTNAYAYVGAALKLQALGWSPEQLQMAEARQHAVLEVARLTGIDPEDLGVSTTSRTYQNGVQRRLDLIDLTLAPYGSAVEDRLTMRDVLPRGYSVHVDYSGFARADEKTRMETYWLGLQVGAYEDGNEVRAAENKPAVSNPVLPTPPGSTGGGGGMAPDVSNQVPNARG